jgi:hypothetical protein
MRTVLSIFSSYGNNHLISTREDFEVLMDKNGDFTVRIRDSVVAYILGLKPIVFRIGFIHIIHLK